MHSNRKSFWTVSGLVAAVCAGLAFVSGHDFAQAQRVDAGLSNQPPVALETDLVQRKILKGADGKAMVAITLTAGQRLPVVTPVQPPTDLVIVLDRSGSMQGRKLADAKQAVAGLVDKMMDGDRFCLVTYSNGVDTIFPLVKMDTSARAMAKRAIGRVHSGGGTNLGGGLQRGIDVLHHGADSARQRKVILISDGLANHGITDPQALGRMAAEGRLHHFSVSTVGVGYDFNEILMTTIADHGGGRYYYLENPNAFAQVFEKALQSTRQVSAASMQIRVTLPDGIQLVDAGGYPIERHQGHAFIQAGDLLSGQTRKLFFTYRVPTNSTGAIDMGEFSVTYQQAGARRDIRASKRLVLTCVEDEKAVLSSIDKTAWGEQVVKEEYSQLREKVADAIRSGRKERALRQIRTYEKDKRAMNRTIGSSSVQRNLDHDLKDLRQKIEDTFSGAPAAVEQKKKQNAKSLQYESYQIRRSKQ